MGECVFCQKIQDGGDKHGEVYPTPLYTVMRFAPLNPVTQGHMLFVPRLHIKIANDGNLTTADAFDAAIRYAKVIGIEDYNLIQSNGVAATQTIPHVHVHFVPRHVGDGLALPWTTQNGTDHD